MKIALSVVLALFLVACSDSSESSSAKKEINKQVEESANVVSKSAQDVVAKTKEATAVVVEQAKVVTKESLKQVQETTQKVVTEVKKASAQAVEDVAHSTAEMATKVEAKAKEVTKEASTVAKPTIDGKVVFTKCVGCHGGHGERKALGKSQIIKGWEASKVVAALHGYKDGSYGGSMKGVMKSQISKLSEEEIQAVAKYISQQ
jgi:cytochrome c553